ncbi:hypothetical protein P280DRAFT_413853 [Massarina eburnea CBS 473.64]|uniref:Cupin 2 conserved barrel domain-containing protein n=1 Tax=Massarina eburnea CBS 473.64 TaxID=1395130 RepID=A0A6A6RK27_9PLEO|nr:hypothetical protein P280DRAFT_413853 [Massarina eburnea CBS 473.64]
MPTNLTNTSTYSSSGSAKTQYNASIPSTALSTSTHTNQDATMVYPTADSNYSISTVTIPPGSIFHPGAHWHEEYDEYLSVVKGRLRILLGKTWRVYTPEDGEVHVKRGVVHDLMRADIVDEEKDEEDVVVQERSDPSDGSKDLFFRHLFAITSIDKDRFGWKVPLQVLFTFAYTDTYMSLVPGPAGWYVTHALWSVVKGVAPWLGLRPLYEAYTPERLKGVMKSILDGSVKSD